MGTAGASSAGGTGDVRPRRCGDTGPAPGPLGKSEAPQGGHESRGWRGEAASSARDAAEQAPAIFSPLCLRAQAQLWPAEDETALQVQEKNLSSQQLPDLRAGGQ